MAGGRNGIRFAVAITGFSLICCVNVACFFPRVFLPSASVEAYRMFNLAIGLSECIAAIAYGAATMRFGRRLALALTVAGYSLLIAGCTAATLMGGETPDALVALAGVFCGVGLAFTMLFWFGTLTLLPRGQAAYVQGLQAFIGVMAFIVLFLILDAPAAPISLGMTVFSVFMARQIMRDAISAESGPGEAEGAAEGDEDSAFAGRESDRWRSLLSACAFPLFGFILISFLYGAVESLAFMPQGSPFGPIVSAWGSPTGALVFLVWQRVSKNHDHGLAVKVAFALLAVLLLAAPFDGIAFFVSVCYQFSGLMVYSQIIDRCRDERLFAVASISAVFVITHVAYVAGLYMPGLFGVRSYNVFTQSTSFLLFFVYLALAVLIVIDRRQHRAALAEAERALTEHRKLEETRMQQKALDEAEEFQNLCRRVGEEANLTDREVEVLALLARGRDLPFICEELFLARNTVKGYTKSIYAKLGVHSKQELINLVDSESKSAAL